MRRNTLILALLMCGVARSAAALSFEYTFAGTLTSGAAATETNTAVAQLTAGTHFTGTVWYTFNEQPLPEGSPSGGTYVPSYQQSYAQPGLIFSLWYTLVFDTAFEAYGHGGTGDVGTSPVVRINDGTTDSFSLTDTRPGSLLGTAGPLSELALGFQFANTALSNRSLPGLIDPALFLGGDLRLTMLTNPCTS